MKRFYKAVDVSDTNAVLLDGKPVKTPQRLTLELPTRALAAAMAEEWRGQGEEIKPDTMPLTRLASTAIDIVAQHRGAVIEQIHSYANSDLLCYRAAEPAELVARQSAGWDPVLEWAAQSYGSKLAVISGVTHVEQPQDALAALRGALDQQSDFALAAMQTATTITGSLVLALALADNKLDGKQAFALSQIDETFQAEKWGRDAEAEARAKRLKAELEAAATFLKLSLSPTKVGERAR